MDKHSPSVLREISYTVGADENGLRADQILAAAFPEYSRARWQAALKAHSILVNRRPAKPKQALFAGDVISGGIEDEDIIVINKAAGMVVHPAVGNADGTLLNAVLHHFPATAQLPRAGIVHRLDKDTSGLMVVAHSLRAHTHLVRQLQEREMGREYLALVHRYVTAGATIDQPIGRHASDRLKMAVRSDGREAITHYRIEERRAHASNPRAFIGKSFSFSGRYALRRAADSEQANGGSGARSGDAFSASSPACAKIGFAAPCDGRMAGI